MNAIRTLPIRLTPVAGEALDSWLEGIAHRTHTAFGDVLSAVGLNSHRGNGTSSWIVKLSDLEAQRMSAATGVAADVLETMTLDHFSERALRTKADTPTLSRTFPWGGACGSRFCPLCLKDTSGRWQLSWRLGWAFACTEHHCLLVDACPECGAVQRRRSHVGGMIPKSGACAHPLRNAIGRRPARCGADLTAAPVDVFDVDHPAIHAQRVVNAVIECDTALDGVYQIKPQPRINVLSDIRAVAGRILAYATPQELQAFIPDDLHAAHVQAARHRVGRSGIARAEAKPGLAAPARAAAAAVGVVAALQALEESDIANAGNEIRWIVASSRKRGSDVFPRNVGWGKGISPVLTGIQLAALGPMLKPCDQLRYRIGSPLPCHPRDGTSRASLLAQRLPSMLWPVLSLRLAIPNCHQRYLRGALPIALLLVNSRLTLDEAAHLVDAPIGGQAVSRVLQLLEDHHCWVEIRAALVRIAEYVADQKPPIDYRRRVRLDYTALLPDEVWTQICRHTGTSGSRTIRARIVRCFLFERLSGLPAGNAPFALDDISFRGKVVDFPRYLTPDLAHALDEHSRDFLAQHGIGGEPPTWGPPAYLLDGLRLPGPDPATVDLTELHRIMAVQRIKLGAAAAHLGTDLHTIRYVLENHPAPLADPAPGTRSGSYNRGYRIARAALSRDRLADLYNRQRMSLRDIADSIGVSRQVIARLASDYDIPLRGPGRHARTTIDRDWLYDQYVNKLRVLPDLAKEVGMSATNMARLAKKHGIPLRGRGGLSHSSSLAHRRGLVEQVPIDAALEDERAASSAQTRFA
jgi:DNA-binding Xre family transcriptional regulator